MQGAWPLPPGALAVRVGAAPSGWVHGCWAEARETPAGITAHSPRRAHLPPAHCAEIPPGASDAEATASTSRGLLEMHGHEQTARCCKCGGDARHARACTEPAALCSGRTQSRPLARQGQRDRKRQSPGGGHGHRARTGETGDACAGPIGVWRPEGPIGGRIRAGRTHMQRRPGRGPRDRGKQTSAAHSAKSSLAHAKPEPAPASHSGFPRSTGGQAAASRHGRKRHHVPQVTLACTAGGSLRVCLGRP